MYDLFWIYILLFPMVIVELKTLKLQTRCPVSELELVCSSSKSVLFKWKTESRWRGSCNHQEFTINYFRPNIKKNYYKTVSIIEKEVLIGGLETDEMYVFKFVHYMNFEGKKNQVKNGFKKKEASPHEVGGVQSLEVINIQLTSAEVTWTVSQDESRCVSHYILHLCWRGNTDRDECLLNPVNKTERYLLQYLTSCTSYTISISAVDIDGFMSSKSVSQTFVTASEDKGMVKDLGIRGVTTGSMSVAWLGRSCGPYHVSIRESREGTNQELQSDSTTHTSYTFTGLEPCSLYQISVSSSSGVDDSSNNQVIQAYTSIVSNATVRNLTVSAVSDSSLTISWQPPDHQLMCVTGYMVWVKLGDETIQTYNLATTHLVVQDLQPCTDYTVVVVVVFSHHTYSMESLSIPARTSAPDNVTVAQLSLEASWNSLQLEWSPPSGYEACTRHYEVRVCKEGECEGPVTLDSPSYHLDGLPVCTSYTAEVRVEQSHNVATVTGFTRGSGAVTSNQLDVVNKTEDAIILRWVFPEDFRNCKGKFVISLWDDKGSVNEDITMGHLLREYTVHRLDPCHKYYFRLTLTDFAGSPIIEYEMVEGTTKAAGYQKVNGLKVNPHHNGMTLEWSMDPGSVGCVSRYQVSLKKRNGSVTIYNTTALTLTWKGDPCSLETVSVQIEDENKLAGHPSYVHLKNELEDLNTLSVGIANVGARDAKVQLISPGFTCISEYKISWYRVTNSSSPHTVANLTSDAKQSVKLSGLNPCTTYSVTITPQSGKREIGVLSSTFTTSYAEPLLIPEVRGIPRGFNISWHLNRSDTVHCLSHVRVTVKGTGFHQQVKVSADSYKVIGNLIPCRQYLITLDSYGMGGTFSRTFFKEWRRTTPEVLLVPVSATLVNVTKASATLDWDVGITDSNLCQPTDVKVECQPGTVNQYISGWQPVRLWLTGLRPYTAYNCQLWVINEAGRSKATRVSFTTSEGVPSQPKNVTIVQTSSTSLTVSWEPPGHIPGVLTLYTVLAYNLTLTYPRPPACPAPPLGPRHVTVGGDTTGAVVGGLPPAAGLWLTVTAATAAGAGPASEPVAATTRDGVSDPVVGLNVTQDRREVSLSWGPPCLSHGKLDHFLVSLSGSRPGHDTARYAGNVTATQTLAEDYSTSLNVSQLTAESLYTVTVAAVGESGLAGHPSSHSFTVPPRIPARASDVVFAQLPPVSTTRSSATVSIRSDLFPDTEGSIRYYAIIVAGNFTNKSRSGWLINHSWPKVKNWASAIQNHPTSAYQATPPWWNPFKDMDTSPFAIKQYTLGAEECSKTDFATFCNGPLQPATSYTVRIRVFTATGFRDSPSIAFQTVDPIVGAYLIILALVVVAVVTTVAFTYLVVRGNIKWMKEKKGLSNSKIKAEEKRWPVICERLPLEKFINHVENIVNSRCLLEQEYNQVQKLTNSISGTTNIATLPQNKEANRYKDIIPYDCTLVKLEGEEESSYINASHIKFKGKNSRCYIACQGPKKETSEDFWNMILQYKVNTIVMLCMPREEGRMKCFTYFPETAGVEGVMNFSRISVYCTREEIFANYLIRYLTIEKNKVTTRVQQFHFTKWPDKKAPEKPEVLVEFIQHIREVTKQRDIPIAVHCSAGVGRTGTFIVVDELLRKIRNTWRCRLSVPDTVLQLRRQRHHKMVQTEDQYGYIYKCLKYALEHHSSLFERVRNVVVRRTKVELEAEEMICMSPNTSQAPDVLQACRTSNT